jgi:predicted DNA-binding protein (UPF0251 family)
LESKKVLRVPRPEKQKIVGAEPEVTYFKPRAVPLSGLKEVTLTVSELEAMRLYDLECLEQGEAAKKMGISQPTLNRLLKSGRKKLTKALTGGQAIKIEGGAYQVKGSD